MIGRGRAKESMKYLLAPTDSEHLQQEENNKLYEAATERVMKHLDDKMSSEALENAVRGWSLLHHNNL